MAPAVFWCTVPRVVGISAIEQGAFVADRYRVVERLTRFAVADSTLTGVEYEYWLALDETRGVEVWLQVAAARDTYASGADLAGVVSTLRRLNHPALPVVLDFGEIEVEVEVEAEAEQGAEAEGVEAEAAGEGAREIADAVVERVGYVVLEPVEAESLATVLLRGALTEAEILEVLVGIADVLKVLHEVQIVHGHLSAYSFLLAENGVLLIDLAAAAALEVAAQSELTSAADVYALAWLACIALAGVEAVEAEFGVGFDAASSPESAAAPQLLTIDLVERRRAWAEANLVATYGLRAQLAALLVAALGEAGARPTVGELIAALRVRENAAEVAAVEEEGEAAAVVEAAAAAVVAGAIVAAAEVGAAEAEAAQTAEVVEEAEVVSAAEEVGYAEVVEESAAAGELVGAGVAVGVAAEAIGGSGGGNRGRGGSGRAGASALASAPLTPTASPSGRHGSPPQRPKSALYVAITIVVLVVGAIVWGCSAGGSSPSAKPTGSPSTAGQATGGQGGSGASPSATSSQAGGVGTTPGASSAASPTQGSNSASPGAGGGVTAAPSYSVTPLATAPASPGQALQQIQQTVSQAEAAGQIPQQAQGPLNQAVGTLQQEIGSKSSVQPGVSQLQSALNQSGVPAGFRQQINQLIPYLSMGQGS